MIQKDKSLWKFFYRLYRGKYKSLLLSAGLTILLSLSYIPIALILRKLLNQDVFGKDISFLVINGALIIGLFLLTLAINLFNKHLVVNTIKSRIRDIREMLMEKIYNLPKSYYNGMEIPEWHTVFGVDLNRIDSLTDTIFMRFIPGVLVLLVTSCVLIYINVWLFLLLLLLSPFITWSLVRARTRLIKLVAHWRTLSSGFSQGILFVLNYMDLTRLQGAEREEQVKQSKTIRALTDDEIQNAWISYLYNSLQETLILVASIIGLVAGGMAVSKGIMTLGDVFTFYVVFMFMRKYIFNLFNCLPIYIRGMDALERLRAVLDLNEQRPYTGTTKIDSCQTIEFRNVSFSYDNRPLLRNINLNIQKGEIILLKGPNGSGKSTLSDLMLGFYKPLRGELFCNGIPYDQIDMINLRQKIGMIPQDCPIFYGTIRENILYGLSEDVPEEDLQKAVEMTRAAEFIENMPDRYETFVGEKGKKVSGGQRQKMGLTRALLRRSDLLVLDEPTNHLDKETIVHFVEQLKQLPDNPAILIISHDPQLANISDVIYSIDEYEVNEVEFSKMAVIRDKR